MLVDKLYITTGPMLLGGGRTVKCVLGGRDIRQELLSCDCKVCIGWVEEPSTLFWLGRKTVISVLDGVRGGGEVHKMTIVILSHSLFIQSLKSFSFWVLVNT